MQADRLNMQRCLQKRVFLQVQVNELLFERDQQRQGWAAVPVGSVRADEKMKYGRMFHSTVWPAPSSSSGATETGCHPQGEYVNFWCPAWMKQ